MFRIGTAAIYGFKKNNQEKISVVNMDGYPNGLGESFIEFIKSCSIGELNKIYDNIVLVGDYEEDFDELKWEYGIDEEDETKENTPITIDDIIYCKQYFKDIPFDLSYPEKIIKELQEFMKVTNRAITWEDLLQYVDENNFEAYKKGFKYMLDYESINRDYEWSYIVDLDKKSLIVEYGETLIQKFLLNSIPNNYLEILNNEFERRNEEDDWEDNNIELILDNQEQEVLNNILFEKKNYLKDILKKEKDNKIKKDLVEQLRIVENILIQTEYIED
jgi:hypothetical protein